MLEYVELAHTQWSYIQLFAISITTLHSDSLQTWSCTNHYLIDGIDLKINSIEGNNRNCWKNIRFQCVEEVNKTNICPLLILCKSKKLIKKTTNNQ